MPKQFVTSEEDFISAAIALPQIDKEESAEAYAAKLEGHFNKYVPKLKKVTPADAKRAIAAIKEISIKAKKDLKSKDIILLAIKSLKYDRNITNICNITHQLSECGFSEMHCKPYAEEIAAIVFGAFEKEFLRLNQFRRSRASNAVSNMAHILLHIKNLGIFSAVKPVIIQQNLDKIAAQLRVISHEKLSDVAISCLLEVGLFCREVLHLQLPQIFETLAQIELKESVTTSNIQRKVFRKVAAYLQNSDAPPQEDEWNVVKKSVRNLPVKIGCYLVSLEGRYGKVGDRFIKSGDIVVQDANGNAVFVIEVDGAEHFANIDSEIIPDGKTLARNSLIQSLTGALLVVTKSDFACFENGQDVAFEYLNRHPKLLALKSKIIESVKALAAEEEVFQGAAAQEKDDEEILQSDASPAIDGPKDGHKTTDVFKAKAASKPAKFKEFSRPKSLQAAAEELPEGDIKKIATLLKEEELDLEELEITLKQCDADTKRKLLSTKFNVQTARANDFESCTRENLTILEFVITVGNWQLLMVMLKNIQYSQKDVAVALKAAKTSLSAPDNATRVKYILLKSGFLLKSPAEKVLLDEAFLYPIVNARSNENINQYIENNIRITTSDLFLSHQDRLRVIEDGEEILSAERAISDEFRRVFIIYSQNHSFWISSLNFAVASQNIWAAKMLLMDSNHLTFLKKSKTQYRSITDILIMAIKNNDTEMLRVFRDAGVNFNEEPDFFHQETLLDRAITENRIDVVRFIVEECGVDVNRLGACSDFPLITACNLRNFEIVRFLISMGANIYNGSDDGLDPPIIDICCDADFEIMELFVENDVDFNTKYKGGGHERSIFSELCTNPECSYEVINFMIDYGADVNLALPPYYVPPLHYAVVSEDIAKVKLLLGRGADIRSLQYMGPEVYSYSSNPELPPKNKFWGNTVLHIAVELQSWDMIEVLCAHNKDNPDISKKVDINALSEHGKTALFMACEANDTEAVRVLLRHNASALISSINSITGEEISPCSCAIMMVNEEMLELIMGAIDFSEEEKERLRRTLVEKRGQEFLTQTEDEDFAMATDSSQELNEAAKSPSPDSAVQSVGAGKVAKKEVEEAIETQL